MSIFAYASVQVGNYMSVTMLTDVLKRKFILPEVDHDEYQHGEDIANSGVGPHCAQINGLSLFGNSRL